MKSDVTKARHDGMAMCHRKNRNDTNQNTWRQSNCRKKNPDAFIQDESKLTAKMHPLNAATLYQLLTFYIARNM